MEQLYSVDVQIAGSMVGSIEIKAENEESAEDAATKLIILKAKKAYKETIYEKSKIEKPEPEPEK